MNDRAKRLGKQPVNTELYFSENNAANDYCPFEVETYSGLTKRELFAAMAMQGLILDPSIENFAHGVRIAVQCADMLLVELSKTESDE